MNSNQALIIMLGPLPPPGRRVVLDFRTHLAFLPSSSWQNWSPGSKKRAIKADFLQACCFGNPQGHTQIEAVFLRFSFLNIHTWKPPAQSKGKTHTHNDIYHACIHACGQTSRHTWEQCVISNLCSRNRKEP